MHGGIFRGWLCNSTVAIQYRMVQACISAAESGAEKHHKEAYVLATTAPRYRFREGALDHIMRSRNLTTDSQLAAAIGIKEEDLQRVRAGALVSARLALKVSALQGDEDYIIGYFEPIYDTAA